MKIFPAIDIKDKKCVRLIKGDFNNKTEYKTSPIDQAHKYKDHGFINLHIVDLDGALAGETVNLDIIEEIASKCDLKIEIGGGVRTFDSIEIAKSGETFTNLDIWLGKKDTVEVSTQEDIYLTIPKRKKKIIDVFVEYTGPIKAPIEKGDLLGTVNVYVSDELVKKVNLYSNEQVRQANIFSRLFRSLNFLVWGDV